MKPVLVKVTVLLAIYVKWVTCSIAGEFATRPLMPGEDPCKPTSYPRHIPDYCFKKILGKVDNRENYPTPSPYPYPPVPIPAGPYMPFPVPPIPYGIPLSLDAPMVPVGGVPYPYVAPLSYPGGYQTAQSAQAGLFPEPDGFVSPEDGINLQPSADAYYGILEQQKTRSLRRRLENLIAEYTTSGRRHGRGRRMQY